MQKKMATATFDLEDFLQQMRAVRKMGTARRSCWR